MVKQEAPKRIALVNDDLSLVKIRKEFLEANNLQVDHYPDYETLLTGIDRGSVPQYDLFLGDFNLDPVDPFAKMNGRRGTIRLLEKIPEARMLGMSGNKNVERKFTDNGAVGFVCTRDGLTAMLEAIRKIFSG